LKLALLDDSKQMQETESGESLFTGLDYQNGLPDWTT